MELQWFDHCRCVRRSHGRIETDQDEEFKIVPCNSPQVLFKLRVRFSTIINFIRSNESPSTNATGVPTRPLKKTRTDYENLPEFFSD